jgi:5-enolpyruvylshikimate-3-phosphate synthase
MDPKLFLQCIAADSGNPTVFLISNDVISIMNMMAMLMVGEKDTPLRLQHQRVISTQSVDKKWHKGGSLHVCKSTTNFKLLTPILGCSLACVCFVKRPQAELLQPLGAEPTHGDSRKKTHKKKGQG